MLAAKLRNSFEDRFRYDDAGVPRVWKPGMTSIRPSAKLAMRLCSHPALCQDCSCRRIALHHTPSSSDDPTSQSAVSAGEEEEFDFPSTLTVFSNRARPRSRTDFARKPTHSTSKLNALTVSSIAQIPVWMYGVMVVLGWNVFWRSSAVQFTLHSCWYSLRVRMWCTS